MHYSGHQLHKKHVSWCGSEIGQLSKNWFYFILAIMKNLILYNKYSYANRQLQ